MKIIRNDETVIEAKQGRVMMLFIGTVFVLLGSTMAIVSITKPAGMATNGTGGLVIGGIVFALAGLALALFANKVHVLADKGTQTIDITKKSIVRNASTSCKFSDVARIDEVTSVNYSAGRQGGTTVQTTMQIVLKDGTIIPLPDDHSSNFSLNGFRLGAIATRKDFAQALANFLGVPFTPYGPQSLGQELNSVVQAVQSNQSAPTVTPVQPVANPTPAAPVATPTVPTQESQPPNNPPATS